MKEQCTDTLLMVRPSHFGYNRETAGDNAFQEAPELSKEEDIVKLAQIEFDNCVDKLRTRGLEIVVIEDSGEPVKPDAVFPNNWLTTHRDGSIITYPMYAPSRRLERREEIIQRLDEEFEVGHRYSFEQYEEKGQFLEGTGSMVLDREKKMAYACLSERTHIELLDKFCLLKNYEKYVFEAFDSNGQAIYHTNVMMNVGSQMAIVCLEAIRDVEEREGLRKKLNESGKSVIEISQEQLEHYAGNMLEVYIASQDTHYLLMSEQARDSLNKAQIKKINDFATILSVDIRNIEKYGGGSVRCMLAEIFLRKK